MVDRRILELQEQRERVREPHRRTLLDRVRGRGIVLGAATTTAPSRRSPRTRATASGSVNSRSPWRRSIARRPKRRGWMVIAGAPNVVCGGSHSGNIAAADLLPSDRGGLMCWCSLSDYVPPALIEAAFRCAREGLVDLPGRDRDDYLPRPPELAGLPDRGRLQPRDNAPMWRGCGCMRRCRWCGRCGAVGNG